MKKLKLRKWVKVMIAIILSIIAILVLSHFILNSIKEFDNYAKECDKAKGSTCTYYEVQKFIKVGDYDA